MKQPADKLALQLKSWGKLRRIRPLSIELSRAELIRQQDPQVLRSPDALAELVLELGLNDDGIDDFPNSLRPHCGFGLRIWQYPREFSLYLSHLLELGVRSYVELGVRHGGTFVTTVECLRRCCPFECALGIDIMPCPSMPEYAARTPGVEFLQINTQSPEFASSLDQHGPFDAALIDANHDAQECRQEFQILHDRCRAIALHDIANTEFPGVATVWNEVKERGDFQCHEYISGYSEPHTPMGIGLAIRRTVK